MANTITFIKNHLRFAWKVRLVTSKIYLEKYKITLDELEKKVMMLRITEELISSTEDLAMWIVAIESRDKPTKKNRDIWEYMLQIEATESQIVDVLKEVRRAKTPKGLAQKLKLPPIPKLALAARMDEETITKVLEEIHKAVKETLHNRFIKRGILIRFHNKVKHGMMIQDYGHELFIRDLKTKINNKTNRINRKNRNLYLEVNLERAEKMVGTIEANSYAIHGLVSLLLYDFIDQFLKRKRKLTEKQKKFWVEALNS